MLVRLVISRPAGELGLFHAACALQEEQRLAAHEEALLRETFDWFNRHLPHPRRFARSPRPHADKKALSWFKDSAHACIARMADLAFVLQEHGHVVKRLATNRPGYVVYEDDYQVVAEPFCE